MVPQELSPAWIPSAAQIEATNIAALMRELHIPSYARLHTWSVTNRAEFWHRMMQRLGIRCQQPYTQLVNLSPGIESPQWLVDAQLNIVESCFQAPADAIALIDGAENGFRRTWSYNELETLTNRVANGLVDLGFQPGTAIAIDMPMTAESVAIYLGIIKAGCVVVGIADSFAAPEIATRLRLASAKAIFTQDWIQRGGKLLPLYTRVVEAGAPPAIVLSHDAGLTVNRRSGDLAWNDFLSPKTSFTAIPATPASHTNILFSSGTTGDPKAIPWTHTTPIKCAVDAHLHQDIHPGDVLAWSTNLGWMMGPWLIYASLMNRAAIALYAGSPTTRGYGQFIQAAGVTMLGVVPSLVSTWKTTQCMQGLDWSAIKVFSSTGECSNPQDMQFLMSLAGNKPIVEYCGGTEIGGAYMTGTLVQPCIPATFTTPALGLDVVILNGEGQPASKGEGFIIPPSIGLSTELLHRNHQRVYFEGTPDYLPAIPLRRHGDYLERLPNGYYRVCGRVDDTMNLGGIKISSADLEQVVNTVEGVAEAVAIALSPPQGGPSQLVIYAVLTPDLHIDQRELKAALQTAIAQQLNPLFKIQDLVIVKSLPRTASNKVMRRVLRDAYKAMPQLKVFVTRRLPASLELLQSLASVEVWTERQPPPYEVLRQKIQDVDGLLCLLTDPIDRRLIEAGTNLKVISQMAVGYDNIDIAAATARQIPVGHTPDVLTDATADFTWALLMAAARRVVEADRLTRADQWKTWEPDFLLGANVAGATLGIVGLGRIGQAVARRAKGFDLRILYTSPTRCDPELEKTLGVEWVEFDPLLQMADFVTIHTPLTPETHHLFGDRQFELMSQTAILINTARGAIVDPGALYRALANGQIAAAALDVTEPEPIPADSPLLTLENLIITPHIASASRQTREKMATMAIANLIAGLQGGRLPHCVNPEVYR